MIAIRICYRVVSKIRDVIQLVIARVSIDLKLKLRLAAIRKVQDDLRLIALLAGIMY
jgi:hypothetical protein